MWLIVGLGNPGRQYAGNRHNAGFMVVDELIRKTGASACRSRFGAELTEAALAGTKVVFCKPMEFMNTSGFPVSRTAAFWKIPPERTLVVHDEMDIALGRLKLVDGGGSGGHNGLRSIMAECGTDHFCRLRFGIGRPPPAWKGADFVLADFSNEERKVLPNLIEEATLAVETTVKEGLTIAMNRFNKRRKSETGGAD